MNIKKLFLTILLLVVTTFATDVMLPSFSHPGDLPLDSVPIFICFGFDDNVYLDGLKWADTTFMSRKNPDGSQVLASFYVSTHPDIENQELWDYIDTVYLNGHEIGNHTQHHDAETFNAQMNEFSLWDVEIGEATVDLKTQSNIPAVEVTGFRTPFLGYSDATFQAMNKYGIKYDCSIEHFATQYKKPDASYAVGMVWPYTLENGPDSSAFKKGVPTSNEGMWELPVYEFQKTTGEWSGVTGFDWNLWFKGYTKDDVITLLKSSLEVRVEGYADHDMAPNRVPFLIGAHSDIYTDDNEANSTASDNNENRRAAITEFIDWALEYNPAVRIVPYRAVIEWMKNPVPYTKYEYQSFSEIATTSKVSNNSSFKQIRISFNRRLKSLNINSLQSGDASLALYSLNGRLISNVNIKLNSGKNSVQIGKLVAAGSYVVRVAGVVNSTKFITVE